jgi:putative aldouronate transport system permease protein
MYSISDSKLAMSGGAFFIPKGFSLLSYTLLFQSSIMFRSFMNSVYRTGIGTLVNVIMTSAFAYPLSIRGLPGKKIFVTFVFVTMIINGGLIPTFLLIKGLGMYNTMYALILPGAISAYNMFIMRNYFLTIPAELTESAIIDGASSWKILLRIIIPISMPIIAAITMFYGVAHWNSFFDGIIYIESRDKMIFQVFLRSMINASSIDQLAGIPDYSALASTSQESIKMSAITTAVIPVLLVYPYLQKHFVKGVLVGSIKG